MNCALHTDAPATGFCRNCGRALCADCTREVRGALYCEPCLAGLVGTPVPAASTAAPSGPHPGAALALGFIPGLGAAYNGEYLKALIHVVIFAGLISAQTQDVSAGYHAFLGIALGCFYFYMPIEAYRTAKAREQEMLVSTATTNSAITATPGGTAPAPGPGTSNRPMGAIILICLGVFLLLANFGMLQWDWFARAWPFALIILGVWLLADRIKAR
jgi:LiaI-LiaF-like transmembrane region/B-box zinc finger